MSCCDGIAKRLSHMFDINLFKEWLSVGFHNHCPLKCCLQTPLRQISSLHMKLWKYCWTEKYCNLWRNDIPPKIFANTYVCQISPNQACIAWESCQNHRIRQSPLYSFKVIQIWLIGIWGYLVKRMIKMGDGDVSLLFKQYPNPVINRRTSKTFDDLGWNLQRVF